MTESLAHSSIVGNPVTVANLLYKILSVQDEVGQVCNGACLVHSPSGGTKKLYVNAFTYFNYYSFEAQRPDKETRAIS